MTPSSASSSAMRVSSIESEVLLVPVPAITGTRLIREWQGVEHTATVLDDGFEYQGRRYKSLSAVARAITGTRWNGPLFWGLRNHRSGK